MQGGRPGGGGTNAHAQFYKYNIQSTVVTESSSSQSSQVDSAGHVGYVMKWTQTHKAPWEVRQRSKRIKVSCPGFEIRVRLEAKPDAEIVTVINNNDELEVLHRMEGNYYQLSNRIGYILANIDGVKYITVANFP